MRGMILLALIGVTATGCLGGDSVPTGAGGNGAAGNGPGAGGTTGAAGTFGTAGTTGTAGTSGEAGTNGVAGTTGTGGSAGDGAGGDIGPGGTTGSGATGGSGAAGVTGTAGTGVRPGTAAAEVRRLAQPARAAAVGRRPGRQARAAARPGRPGRRAGAERRAPEAAAERRAPGGSTGNFFPTGPLRVDDPCSSLLSGNVCLHQGKTSDNGTPFDKKMQITVSGTPGTMYQVKIHIRGVTEPTHVMGGTPGTPANFITGGTAYADNQNEGQYQQWRLTTTVPNKYYYLNVFTEGLSHIVKLLDYTETIQIGGGSVVTLDVHDGNAHEISNTVNNPPLAPTGVSGSMSSGQFVQIDADSAQ